MRAQGNEISIKSNWSGLVPKHVKYFDLILTSNSYPVNSNSNCSNPTPGDFPRLKFCIVIDFQTELILASVYEGERINVEVL